MEHKLFTELKNTKQKILWVLERSEICRDDDSKLYANYIALQLGAGDKSEGLLILQKMSALDFITNLAQHDFINYATLIRGRRLIQADEKYKHLRGTKYEARSDADDHFRKNIHTL